MTPKIKTTIEMNQEEWDIAQKLRKKGFSYVAIFRIGLNLIAEEQL